MTQSENDNFSITTADNCSGIADYENQVGCVVNDLGHYLKWDKHHELYRSPTELVQKGGVCRDVAVTYATIFDRLGWHHSFNFPMSDHVFLSISKNTLCDNPDLENCGIYCNVDWTTYSCYRLGNIKDGANVTQEKR